MKISIEKAKTTSTTMVYVYFYDENKGPCASLNAVADIALQKNEVKAFRIKNIINNSLDYNIDMIFNSLKKTLTANNLVKKDNEGNILVTFKSIPENSQEDLVWDDSFCLIDVDLTQHSLLGIEFII